MKLCPNCSQVYYDDTLNFCLADGTPLRHQNVSEETVVMGSPLPSQISGKSRQGVNPYVAYFAIGLLALVAGGAIVGLLMSRSSVPSNVPTQQTNVVQTSNSNSASQNIANIPEPVSSRVPEIVRYPDSKPEPVTAEAVRNLLSAWEQAQDGKSFSSYQSCYDPSFVGVKMTKTGRSQTYSYNSWMADRRKMIAGAINLRVDVSNLQIRMEGDTAIAQFDQYYRSLRYSDWGPKEIQVKMTASGPKIIREVLKASYPL